MNGETDTWICPEYYPLIQAAKYLGVAPWELLAQPIWWREKAQICMAAEEQARESLEKQRNSKQ